MSQRECLGGDFFPAKLYIMWMAVESPNLFVQSVLPEIMRVLEAGFNHNDFESLFVSLKYWVKTDHLK